MTAEIFHWWINEVFIPHIEKTRFVNGLQSRYALLLVDGHFSRANPAMLSECLQAKIMVKTLVARLGPKHLIAGYTELSRCP